MADDEKRKLYRQIVMRASEWLMLDRMRVYGFWPMGEGLPDDPPEEVAERKQLEQRLAELRQGGLNQKKGIDPEQALAQERKRRWAESKKKRAEKKAQRKAAAEAGRQAWTARRSAEVVHAGTGVSAQLSKHQSDAEALGAQGLPVVHTAAELAAAMGLSLGRLRWLTYHREVVALVHYHRYDIAKKSGGRRNISAPKAELAKAQQWVLEQILERFSFEPEAHGFITDRSIVSNASPHVGRKLVVNLDLADFFPTINLPRVRGLFRKLGYSGQVATLLALLCTEPPRTQAEVGGKVLHVALGERRLPQGACTSPALTNLICRRLDRRLAGLARGYGFAYTRYADDLTFSGDASEGLGRLLGFTRHILKNEGFAENPDKTRIMRQGRCQQVTGVVVNQRPSISRKERRRLRALLHNAARHGLESQNREERPNFAQHLHGLVAYFHMVDPRGAQPLWAALRKILG